MFKQKFLAGLCLAVVMLASGWQAVLTAPRSYAGLNSRPVLSQTDPGFTILCNGNGSGNDCGGG